MSEEQLSKFISLILRHKPEEINIKLDAHGWANVNELISGVNNSGRFIDMPTLEQIVKNDSKQRYSFNDDKTLIRANQGHSVNVDVELEKAIPPDVLYHGTADKYINAIKEQGLKPMSRLYVHLSTDEETASNVGNRHGKLVMLQVDSKKMVEDGVEFYHSKNGVWLTKYVDKKYLTIK